MILIVLLILVYFFWKKKNKEHQKYPLLNEKVFPLFSNKIKPLISKLENSKNNISKYKFYLEKINNEFEYMIIQYPKRFEPQIADYYDYIMDKYNNL